LVGVLVVLGVLDGDVVVVVDCLEGALDGDVVLVVGEEVV